MEDVVVVESENNKRGTCCTRFRLPYYTAPSRSLMLKHTPDDNLPTQTSCEQRKTEGIISECLPSPETASTLEYTLNRNGHLSFVARAFLQGFPKQYMYQDASQPWFMFWLLQSFSLLGADIGADNKQRAIDTILAAQHPDGGFGGGPHQAAHLLPTYASVCALAIVGRPGPGGGWDQIDRKGLYSFFMSLKQPDGSFRVAKDAEVDIRGTYCLLAVATLLNLLTPTLVHAVPAFVRSCQTYEGGFASASQPYYGTDTGVLPKPRPPLGEAHGGYTSCALNSWLLLQPFVHGTDEPQIDVKNVLRWLAKMQCGPMDLGGFRGRTNKLVDGCYSWWVGGCFALLEGLGAGAGVATPLPTDEDSQKSNDSEMGWYDFDDEMFSKTGLQEYILLAAQSPSGGLRDKPPKAPDAYHTLYNLAGLSAAQHRVYPSPVRKYLVEQGWTSQPHDELSLDESETPSQRDARRKRIFVAAQSWMEDESPDVSRVLGGASNRVNATQPLFNLVVTHSRVMLNHFYGQR